MKRILFASLLLASCGQGGGTPDIVVSDAWARATVAGQTSAAAYMTITNKGGGSDRLVAISAAPPAMAMLHETASAGGVSSMQQMADGIDLPAGQKAELKPLATHVMITGLKQPLTAGSTLPLTVRFRHSGERRVEVRVLDASAAGPR